MESLGKDLRAPRATEESGGTTVSLSLSFERIDMRTSHSPWLMVALTGRDEVKVLLDNREGPAMHEVDIELAAERRVRPLKAESNDRESDMIDR